MLGDSDFGVDSLPQGAGDAAYAGTINEALSRCSHVARLSFHLGRCSQ